MGRQCIKGAPRLPARFVDKPRGKEGSAATERPAARRVGAFPARTSGGGGRPAGRPPPPRRPPPPEGGRGGPPPRRGPLPPRGFPPPSPPPQGGGGWGGGEGRAGVRALRCYRGGS